MSTKIIVSYDGTANEDDAVALGRLFATAGAEVSLAYVRHATEPDSAARMSPSTRPALLGRGAALLGDPNAATPRGHRPLHSRGPRRRSPSARAPT